MAMKDWKKYDPDSWQHKLDKNKFIYISYDPEEKIYDIVISDDGRFGGEDEYASIKSRKKAINEIMQYMRNN